MELKVKSSLSLPSSISPKDLFQFWIALPILIPAETLMCPYLLEVTSLWRGEAQIAGGIQANWIYSVDLEKTELVPILQVALVFVTFQWLVSVNYEKQNFGLKSHTFCCLITNPRGGRKREYEWNKKISDLTVLFLISVTSICCSVSYVFSWIYSTDR